MDTALHEIIVTPENIPAWICLHKPGTADVAPHWHESIELICSLDSRLDILRSGRMIHLPEYDVAVINNCEIHAVVPVSGYRNHGISITFDSSYFEDKCPDIETPFFEFTDHEDVRKEIAEFMKRMHQLYLKPSESRFLNLEVNSLLMHISYCLLSYFLVSHSETIKKISGKYQERYRKIMSYIKDHCEEPLTLSDVAAYSHLSKEHLSREFKNYVGEGFRDYLNNVRLAKAQYDLIYTDLPLIDIAIKYGFNDLRSYNRAFKSHYDHSPAQYRRIMKRDPSQRPVYNPEGWKSEFVL